MERSDNESKMPLRIKIWLLVMIALFMYCMFKGILSIPF